MKKGINLLKTQKRFIHLENVFRTVKSGTIVIFFVFLATYLVFYYLLSRQKQKINGLISQKKELLDFFIQNKEVEAKFVYFKNKQNEISNILKEDVNFFPYYNLLKESLKQVNVEAQLESVLIDKSKSVSFSLSFNNYSGLLTFLKFAESDDFLQNFNQLSLINFSRDDSRAKNSEYKLNFSGKFINLNEN